MPASLGYMFPTCYKHITNIYYSGLSFDTLTFCQQTVYIIYKLEFKRAALKLKEKDIALKEHELKIKKKELALLKQKRQLQGN